MAKEPDHTLGDAPIEARHRETMKAIADLLERALNKGGERKFGFVLMLFDFGDEPGRCNYISNAERADVITLMKEQIARFEGQPEMEGHA
jgi:hypothetical protein